MFLGPISSAREDYGVLWWPLLLATAGLIWVWINYAQRERSQRSVLDDD